MSWKLSWMSTSVLVLIAFFGGLLAAPLFVRPPKDGGPPPPCDQLTYATGCTALPSGTGVLVASPASVQYVPGTVPLGNVTITITNPAGATSPVTIADVALSACVTTGWERIGVGYSPSCVIHLYNSGGLPGTLAPGQSASVVIQVAQYSKRAKLEFLDSGGAVLLTVPIAS